MLNLTELSEDNLTKLWDASQQGLIIVNYSNNKIENINQTALDFFAYDDKEDLLDTSIEDLYFYPFSQVSENFFLAPTEPKEVITDYENNDGEILRLRTTLYPVFIQEEEYLIYRMTDLTDKFSEKFSHKDYLASESNLFAGINNLEDNFIKMQSETEFKKFLQRLLELILDTLNFTKGFIILKNFFTGTGQIKVSNYDFELDYQAEELIIESDDLVDNIDLISRQRKEMWEQRLDLNEERVFNFVIKENNDYLGEIVVVGSEDSYTKIKKILNIYSRHIKLGINNIDHFLAKEKSERIDHELDIAARIQTSFTPKSTPRHKNFSLALYTKPAAEVGGDYLGFNDEGEQFKLLISDVMGKGIPAAIVVATIHSAFNILSRLEKDPAQILTNLNHNLYQDLKNSATFVSALSASFLGNRLVYSNAAANAPLFWSQKEQSLSKLEERGILCGIQEEYNYTLHQIELQPKDLLLFYTDGLIDIRNQAGERFGLERLKDLFKENSDLSAEDLKEKIVQNIYFFAEGVEYPDDITFIVARFIGEGGADDGL
ncbi:MAG: SpoIIE family protein phosphatase [Halanaerobacter sp.]